MCVSGRGGEGSWGGPAREARGLGAKAVPHWALSAFRGRSVHPCEPHLGVLGGGGRAGGLWQWRTPEPRKPRRNGRGVRSLPGAWGARGGEVGGRGAHRWAWLPRLLRNGGPRPLPACL